MSDNTTAAPRPGPWAQFGGWMVAAFLVLGLVVAPIIVIRAIATQGGGGASRPAGEVNRAMYGEAWPLSVESGFLACKGSDGFGSVTLKTGGAEYGLNGVARSAGYPSADAIHVVGKDIGVLISRGLELCR